MEIVFFRILEEFFLFPATFYGGKNLYGKQRNKSLFRWFFVDSSPSDCVPSCPRSGEGGRKPNGRQAEGLPPSGCAAAVGRGVKYEQQPSLDDPPQKQFILHGGHVLRFRFTANILCWVTNLLYQRANSQNTLPSPNSTIIAKRGPPTKTTICFPHRGRLRWSNHIKGNPPPAFHFDCGPPLPTGRKQNGRQAEGKYQNKPSKQTTAPPGNFTRFTQN